MKAPMTGILPLVFFNNNSVDNCNAMNVKTLERCFNERVDREMNNIVDTVEDRIQNAILTAIDNIVAPKIELAIRSISASSGRDVTSVSVNSERREHAGINASFENASGNNDTQVISKVNDETRHSITEELSELSVPETHFDRQPHTHHMVKGNGDRHSQTHHSRSHGFFLPSSFFCVSVMSILLICDLRCFAIFFQSRLFHTEVSGDLNIFFEALRLV